MNARKLVGWFLTILLTLAFVASAISKLIGIATQMFIHWGYPAWFATVIGGLELLGAIGILIQRLSLYATLVLTVIMLGAAYTHLANHEGLQVLRPIIFIAVLWLSWWLRLDAARASAARYR